MQRRRFIRLAGGGLVLSAAASTGLLSACSSQVPTEAIEAWTGASVGLAQTDPRRWVLSHALLAPNAHNLQSWVADLRQPDQILLYCDLKRLLPQTDPYSRQIMLSHGTFLELLDLAAREAGLRADIALFPEGVFSQERPDARPVARIRLSRDSNARPDPLFAQILKRHTHRGIYDPQRAIPAVAWKAMDDSVAGFPVQAGHAGVEDAPAMTRLRAIAQRAWDIEMTTPRTVMESMEVLRVGAAEVLAHRDGVTLLDPKVELLTRLGLFDRTKAPGPDEYATTSQIKGFAERLESTPGYWWITSPDNTRITQIQAGRAYVRAQLAATAQGLSMQPLSQALQEYPEQAQPYADIHAHTGAAKVGGTVQMWVRVGYAPAIAPAPRRRLTDITQA